jgi:hypothetical protein
VFGPVSTGGLPRGAWRKITCAIIACCWKTHLVMFCRERQLEPTGSQTEVLPGRAMQIRRRGGVPQARVGNQEEVLGESQPRRKVQRGGGALRARIDDQRQWQARPSHRHSTRRTGLADARLRISEDMELACCNASARSTALSEPNDELSVITTNRSVSFPESAAPPPCSKGGGISLTHKCGRQTNAESEISFKRTSKTVAALV